MLMFVDILHCINNIWRFLCASDAVGELIGDIAAFERKLVLLGSEKVYKKLMDLFKCADEFSSSCFSIYDANQTLKELTPLNLKLCRMCTKIGHNLNKVEARYGIPVVFSTPNTLAQLCPHTTSTERLGCLKKHAKQFVHCAVGVVYRYLSTAGSPTWAKWADVSMTV